ncbi:phosphoribosyltransferase family protein [Brevibacillus sp. SYSU BS000544]|uniref:phosphoribosyltransferase family protein n=1 Tax=Brevibacillus sp. SYSU BS000544 TaxID=3416443 RepID=UPI003CE48A18
MSKTISPTYSSKRHTFNILGDLSVNIEITNNPFNFSLEHLFTMASRINRKRGFLFVSKVLGKHLPIIPAVGHLGGAALAASFLSQIHNVNFTQTPKLIEGIKNVEMSSEIFDEFIHKRLPLPEETLFIGFAETATALGQSMFASFKENARYIHTTRELLTNKVSVINFEEEHSHATSHRCYADNESFLSGNETVVLVDDEITTGKTALNIIRELHQKFPRKKYVLASLLDWRSDQDRKAFSQAEEELGTTIHTISLLEGRITVHGQPSESNGIDLDRTSSVATTFEKIYLPNHFFKKIAYTSSDSSGFEVNTPYIFETGRFGIHCENTDKLQRIAKEIGSFLQSYRRGSGPTLSLGTGEFMYLPMLISHYMGKNLFYHSTTRSPIYPCNKKGYGAKNAYVFNSPDDPNIINYFYNVPFKLYDSAFIFFERDLPDERFHSLKNQLSALGIPHICMVVCSSK